MEIRTHLGLDHDLCGTPVAVGEERAEVVLETTSAMAADERGLVHGGFVFGLADHAAMLAVNHPNVVLGQAEARFLAPVRVGETLLAEAWVESRERKKILVRATVRRGDAVVFDAGFVCFTPERHILETSR